MLYVVGDIIWDFLEIFADPVAIFLIFCHKMVEICMQKRGEK